VEDAEELVRGVDDPLLRACVLSMRGFSERHFGNMTNAQESIERAVQLFAEVPPALEAGFYLNGYLTSLGYRHWVNALTGELDREAIEHDYLTHDLPFARGVFSLFGSAATMAAGDQDGLRLYAERGVEADPEGVLSFWSASAEMYLGVSLVQQGEHAEGVEWIDRGRAHMAEAGGRTMLAGIFSAAARALALAGELTDAKRMLQLARAEIDEAHELAYQPFVALAAAHVAAAEGDAATAERFLDLAAQCAADHGSLGAVARIARERSALRLPQSTG
jgi:hypothetical protein